MTERPSIISRARPELRAERKVGRVPSVARPAPARADTASTEVWITLGYQYSDEYTIIML